jgi:hypothetical protein
VSRITFCLSYPCRITTHLLDPGWRPDPHGGLGVRRRCFLVLMVGAHGSPAPPPRGAAVDVFCVDGGRSRISITASQGAHHRRFLVLMVGPFGSLTSPPRGPSLVFLALMVGAPGSLAPPPRGPTIDVFCIDGGCSRIFCIASQGVRHRCFLCCWWVLPDFQNRLPEGLPSTFLSVYGGRSCISVTTSQGPLRRCVLH